MTPFIETFSGARFQPLAAVNDTIWIEDITHALSNQCRFTGHTREFYSVAEHSVRVSFLVQEWGCDEDEQFWGLLHDASEAYIADISTPVKQSGEMEEYRRMERELMRAICIRFGMPDRMPDSVRLADAVMLATEVRDLMPARPEHWRDLVVKPHVESILTSGPWAPKEAERRFLERFRDLDGRR